MRLLLRRIMRQLEVKNFNYVGVSNCYMICDASIRVADRRVNCSYDVIH